MDYPYKVGFGAVTEAYKPYWNKESHEYLIIVNNDEPLCYNNTVMGEESNYMASLTTLGYIDFDTDEHCSEKGTILWEMRPDEYDSEIHKSLFKGGTIYHIRAAMQIDNNVLYPLEVIREWKMEYFLDNLYEAYVKKNNIPVYLETKTLGNLLLNQEYDRYNGCFKFKGREVAISITHYFDSKKLVPKIETFVRDFEAHDEEMRRYAAENLTSLANEWADKEGNANITEEDFYNRLVPEAIYMSITSEYDVYYHSDGLFKNHSIKVTVNSKGPKDAEIWDDIIYIRHIFGGE